MREKKMENNKTHKQISRGEETKKSRKGWEGILDDMKDEGPREIERRVKRERGGR